MNNRDSLIWMLVLIVGIMLLVVRHFASDHGFGKVYSTSSDLEFVNVGTEEEPNWLNYSTDEMLDYPEAATPFEELPAEKRVSWTTTSEVAPNVYHAAVQADPNQTQYRLDWARTVGLWAAAFFTLAIFSFLYKDNPFYKIAEAVVVGVSAAYWMVVGFWDVLVPNLFAKLAPSVVKAWSMPGLEGKDLQTDLLYLVPLTLGVMLLWRLAPVGGWISRWPLAFIIGTTAGLRLLAYLHADFLSQIRNGIEPLLVMGDQGIDVWNSLRHFIVFFGVLACLVYFFFSIEHKGAVGATARVGIWILMITFGAGFGYTVMGRIALLAIRLEFLFIDWLWLIDPQKVLPGA